MSEIRLQRNLKVPPVPALSALGSILSSISAQEGRWRGFALHVSLGDVRLPDVGYVAIPIRLTSSGTTQGDARSIPIEFGAAEHAEAFPHFKGAAGIDATGPTGSILWIAGSYEVPMQTLGAILDRTVIGGVADRSLVNLIDDLAAAVVANVEKSEAEYVRYHRF